jgi:hypothetical protein
MANVNGAALSIARAYFDAMRNRDVGKIMTPVTDDVTCDSPVGRLAGAPAFRGFQEGFARMIKKLKLVAAFGDDEHAVIVYDAETHPVASSFVAEHIIVKSGKIASTRVIYDATPVAAYMATAQPH